MVLKLIDGRLDSSQYEDSCRALLGELEPSRWTMMLLLQTGSDNAGSCRLVRWQQAQGCPGIAGAMMSAADHKALETCLPDQHVRGALQLGRLARASPMLCHSWCCMTL